MFRFFKMLGRDIFKILIVFFLVFSWRTVLSETVNEVGIGLIMFHEISRISNTGVLALVVAKYVSSC